MSGEHKKIPRVRQSRKTMEIPMVPTNTYMEYFLVHKM